MRKLILGTALFLVTLTVKAQGVDFGLRLGANLFDIAVSEFKNSNGTVQSIESGDRKLGYHAGIYGQVSIATFFIRPELLYTFQNSEVQYTDNGGAEKTLEIDYSRFDVPIIVGAKLGPIRLGVGPVASFAISKPDGAFNKSLKDATFGYQASLGVDLAGFSIDVRYEGALSKYAESVTIDGQSYQADSRTTMFMLGLGIELF